MKEVDVSVIMPAYNAAAFIEEAIDSILNQEFKGCYELLIADDCSTDNTVEIISRYAMAFPEKIKQTLNDKNLGPSSNYNQLSNRAKGKYLAFCDSDDWWTSSLKLQKQFDYLESHSDIGMVCSADNSYVFGEADNCNDSRILSFESLIKGRDDIQNSSIMCRKSLFDKMRQECHWFVEHNCFFDSVWAYWFSLYSKIWCMEEKLSVYRDRDNSDCRSTDEKKRYRLDKRYYMIKTRFLLTNGIDADAIMDYLLQEYDCLYEFAKWKGESKVRQSVAYRVGSSILHPLKMVKE